MKIRTKLYFSAIVSIGLLSILSLSIFLLSFKINEELKKEALAYEFTKVITEVLILAQRYTALQSVRTEKLLDLKLENIEEIIKKSEGIIPLQIIRNAFKSLNDSYSHLKANYREQKQLLKDNAPVEEIDRTVYIEEALATIMYTESHKILDIASRISSEARERTNVIQKQRNLIFSIFAILLVVLIGISTLLNAKSITKPLTLLEQSAYAIGAGELDKSVPVLGKDEFGSLAETLDDMRLMRRKAEAEINKYTDALEQARNNLEQKVKERTRELAQVNIQLKEMDRLKSEFIATMSHELRTPLNSIIGFVGIVFKGIAGEINEEQKKQLSMAYGSAKHLLSLINDILDLSRIESGKVETSLERFNIEEVVSEVAQSLSPTISQKGLRLIIEIPDETPEIFSDRKRVLQILLNLVNNSVKFTNKGEIKIECNIDNNDLKVSVSDTGIGIKKENMEYLFEAFRQIDGTARRIYEGAGLGLHLCRKLVTLLGGKIWAESEYGKGSKFTFTLPLRFEKGEQHEKKDIGSGR